MNDSAVEQSLVSLRNALASEIKYEERHSLDYRGLFGYFQTQGWTVEDLPKNPVVYLHRQVNPSLKLTIKVHIESPKLNQQKEIDAVLDQLQSEMEAEADESRQQLLRQQAIDLELKRSEFSVLTELLIDRGNQSIMKVDIVHQGDDFTITDCNVLHTTVSDYLKTKLESRTETISLTSGFEEVDKSISDSLQEFVTAIGIDAEFARRIQQLSVAKDQELYFGFLGRLSDFLTFERE